MAGLSGAQEAELNELSEDVMGFLLVVVGLVLSCFCCRGVYRRCCCCCCGCCGRRSPESNGEKEEPGPPKVRYTGKEPVAVAHLRHRKELSTAYALWLCSGIYGGHHFYLERLVHGFLTVWSLNFLSIGWFIDGLLIPVYVNAANRFAPDQVSSDGSCRRLCCRLPSVLGLWLGAMITFFIFTPRVLHNVGVVDIDQAVAGTERNPYDTLGVPRGASHEEAMAAYREQMRRVLSGPVCSSKCEEEKKQLDLVLDFLDGAGWKREDEEEEGRGEGPSRTRSSRRERGRAPGGERAWDDWTDFVNAEWRGLTDLMRERTSGEEPERRERRRRRQGRAGGEGERGGSATTAPPSSAKKSKRGKRRTGSQGKGSDL